MQSASSMQSVGQASMHRPHDLQKRGKWNGLGRAVLRGVSV
jgi:hypothetical protein